MLDLGQYVAIVGSIVYFLVFLLGLILGSFLNSWMWRVRENIRILAKTRSMCVSCRRQLKWYENIPLFSWLVLCGKCRTCKKNIPFHYVLVELATAFLMMFVVYQHVKLVHFSEWGLLRDTFFLTLLIIIFVYDWLYRLILSRIIWCGTIIGFAINVLFINYSAVSLLIGIALGGGFFLLQFLISRGKWIGGGDIRMGVMMGVWLGWPNILVALFVAYILGAVVGVFLLLFKKANRNTEIPFGTFLALGTFFSIYYGTPLITWYMSLLK